MAIDPSNEFPTKIDTSDPTGYPFGKAQNISSPGDGTGTPWIALLVNDIFGFQQALLKEPAVPLVPSGTPDKVGASQYLTALKTIIAENSAGGGFGAVENKQSGAYSLVSGDYGGDNDVTVVYTGSGGQAFTHSSSASLTAGDYVWVEHRGTGILEINFTNGSDTFGATSLGRVDRFMSPGERVRFALTADANIWSEG